MPPNSSRYASRSSPGVKPARKGRAPLEQIQLTLGHASISTTDRYLGTELNLDATAVDYTGLAGS
ncbi:MAG: hypothetical protein EXR51_11600 [Dehalococcoidia bacterium]|nr:hypothetical protein [Dehalococcoidia bacterium]